MKKVFWGSWIFSRVLKVGGCGVWIGRRRGRKGIVGRGLAGLKLKRLVELFFYYLFIIGVLGFVGGIWIGKCGR